VSLVQVEEVPAQVNATTCAGLPEDPVSDCLKNNVGARAWTLRELHANGLGRVREVVAVDVAREDPTQFLGTSDDVQLVKVQRLRSKKATATQFIAFYPKNPSTKPTSSSSPFTIGLQVSSDMLSGATANRHRYTARQSSERMSAEPAGQFERGLLPHLPEFQLCGSQCVRLLEARPEGVEIGTDLVVRVLEELLILVRA